MAEPIALHGGEPPAPGRGAAGAGRGEGSGGRNRNRKPKEVDTGNLHALYAGFAYQYGSDIAWDTKRLQPIRISHLRHTFGNMAVKMWMDSPRRSVVMPEHVVFEPGAQLQPGWLNLYRGLAIEPEPGDCSVILELLAHLCSESRGPDGVGPEDVMDWVLKWCAYPFQNPGAKMDTALVFHGPQGTGKNLFFDVIRDLWGEYGVMVGQTELEDKFNAWLSRRCFIVGDEVVSRQEMYHVKNRLKWIVTQKTKIPIRAMQMDTRWESNHANLVFLSNESRPLALEEGDRRYLVVYTPTADAGDLYARVHQFLANGGAARLLHHLLTIPLDGFNEHTKPLMTIAKSELIEACSTSSHRFASEWLNGFLPLPRHVCSVEQLFKAARRWADANGERLPPQAMFSAEVGRYAKERRRKDATGRVLPPPLVCKVIGLKAESKAGRTSVRCWVPEGCSAPAGVTEGAWAADCVASFEDHLRNFLRHGRDEDGAA